jgi:protein-disulfide isomerase
MQKITVLLLALCTTLSLFAQENKSTSNSTNSTSEKSASPLTQQTVDSFLHHTLGYDENLKWKVTEIKPGPDPSMTEVNVLVNTPQGQQAMKIYVTPDQKFAINGDVIPFGADPYAAARETLQKNATGPSRGAANPEVTIVEFADLQCPVCKKAQPTVEKLMNDTPNAKLIFQQFPLVQIHKWAMIAAKYGECVRKQNADAFWKYLTTVYEHQDEMQSMTEDQAAEKLKGYAGEVGVNADQAAQCTSDPAIAAKILQSISLGQDMEVTGTPTLFIGGRRISNVTGIPYELLKTITDFQAKNK